MKGRTIIVVDDVFTTGTTVEECARVLKRAGAAAVWVATVARVAKLEVAQHHPMLQHNIVAGQAARA